MGVIVKSRMGDDMAGAGLDADRGRDSRDRMLQDLQAVIADAQTLMNEAAGSSSEHFAEVRNNLQGRFDNARISLLRAREELKSRAAQAGRRSGRYIRENPWKTTGFATSAGLIVGLVLLGMLRSGK